MTVIILWFLFMVPWQWGNQAMTPGYISSYIYQGPNAMAECQKVADDFNAVPGRANIVVASCHDSDESMTPWSEPVK